MGRKGRGISVDRTIGREYDRVGRDYDTLQDRVTGRYPAADERANALYGNILDRANAGANRTYSPGDFESYGIMRGFAGPEGGLDPSRIGSIDENIASYKEIGRTGGWSDQDQSNARLRASRTPTAFYTNLKNDMERRRNVTGGQGVGFGTSDARATREAARAAAEGTLDADIGISESIRSGKLSGLAGAQGAEMALLDAISSNQRFGASGMQQGEGMALDATQRENMAGLSQLAQLYGMAPGEIGQLLGAELDTLGQRGSQVQGLIGQQGAEDNRRWQRKGSVANAAGGAATTAAGGGAGGTGQFMNKPRTA